MLTARVRELADLRLVDRYDLGENVAVFTHQRKITAGILCVFLPFLATMLGVERTLIHTIIYISREPGFRFR